MHVTSANDYLIHGKSTGMEDCAAFLRYGLKWIRFSWCRPYVILGFEIC